MRDHQPHKAEATTLGLTSTEQTAHAATLAATYLAALQHHNCSARGVQDAGRGRTRSRVRNFC